MKFSHMPDIVCALTNERRNKTPFISKSYFHLFDEKTEPWSVLKRLAYPVSIVQQINTNPDQTS